MGYDFSDVIASLEDIGFYEVALPFLLIFTITFAILQKINIFGEKSKKFNAIIAIIMAFLVVRTDAIVTVMNDFLPQISLMALVIVVILLLVGIVLTPKSSTGFTGWFGGLAMLLAIGGVIIAFISSSEPLGLEIPDWLMFSGDDWRLLIGIGIFFVFIAWITADPEEPSFVDQIGDALKGLPGQFGGGS